MNARVGMGGLALLCSVFLSGGVAQGFNPQPDPPGFGLVTLDASQTIRMNVVCFEHSIGRTPPDPCRGEFMFHDAAGEVLKRGTYDLAPGEVAVFDYTPRLTRDGIGSSRMSILPCILPAPGGRAIPTVEVRDRETGRTALFANPAAARMGEFNNGKADPPGERVGFNPQPDPPGFGAVTMLMGQTMRVNVACFDHQVGRFPPDPCRGEVMFHDAAGASVSGGSYRLQPGEATAFEFTVPFSDFIGDVLIIPCVLPAPGGHAVPSVEIADGAGRTTLLINPAVPQMSDFAR